MVRFSVLHQFCNFIFNVITFSLSTVNEQKDKNLFINVTVQYKYIQYLCNHILTIPDVHVHSCYEKSIILIEKVAYNGSL